MSSLAQQQAVPFVCKVQVAVQVVPIGQRDGRSIDPRVMRKSRRKWCDAGTETDAVVRTDLSECLDQSDVTAVCSCKEPLSDLSNNTHCHMAQGSTIHNPCHTQASMSTSTLQAQVLPMQDIRIQLETASQFISESGY